MILTFSDQPGLSEQRSYSLSTGLSDNPQRYVNTYRKLTAMSLASNRHHAIAVIDPRVDERAASKTARSYTSY